MNNGPALELPLGTSSFEALRQSHQIYVDKTDIIFGLASKRAKYFLARPRRFGKSLLISTFECLFKKGISNFKNLKIENLWKEENTYSVITLDFSTIGYFTNLEDFKERFRSLINLSFIPLGFYSSINENSFYIAFSIFLRNLNTDSLVLLVDECDFPLIACLNNPELFEQVRQEIANFYDCIKSADNVLRFLFITGITKFGKASILSSLNNFVDLTLTRRAATLLGYTKEELERYFHWYIDNASQALSMDRSELLENMAINYDGFRFSGETEAHVFAPWSVLNFFDMPKAGFQSYWIESGGGRQVLRQYLNERVHGNPNNYFQPKQISINSLKSTSEDIKSLNDLMLLTHAGYLTIKSVESCSFEIGYPNREVADALGVIYREQLWSDTEMDNLGSTQLSLSLQNGTPDTFVQILDKFFLALGYKRFPIRSETECRNFIRLILLDRTGINVFSECYEALGNSGLEIRTQHFHWVLELRFVAAEKSSASLVERKLKEAESQILKKQYGEPEFSDRKLIRLAIVFSEKHRKFIAWKEATTQ